MSQTREGQLDRPLRWIGVVASAVLGAYLLVVGFVAQSGGTAFALWGGLNLATALGVALRVRLAFLLEALLGIALCVVAAFIAGFCVLMLVSQGGSLDGPLFGIWTGVILNGWASLGLFALLLAGGVGMIATGWRGMRDGHH